LRPPSAWRARGAGADLALVEGERHQPLDGLVEELVVGIGEVLEEDVRLLPPSASVAGNRLPAEACALSRSMVVEPLNASFAMRLLLAIPMPVSLP
jgi:hypothetical protein